MQILTLETGNGEVLSIDSYYKFITTSNTAMESQQMNIYMGSVSQDVCSKGKTIPVYFTKEG